MGLMRKAQSVRASTLNRAGSGPGHGAYGLRRDSGAALGELGRSRSVPWAGASFDETPESPITHSGVCALVGLMSILKSGAPSAGAPPRSVRGRRWEEAEAPATCARTLLVPSVAP
jgi:hypothetical protein